MGYSSNMIHIYNKALLLPYAKEPWSSWVSILFLVDSTLKTSMQLFITPPGVYVETMKKQIAVNASFTGT